MPKFNVFQFLTYSLLFWNFHQKILENILEYTGISLCNLSGHSTFVIPTDRVKMGGVPFLPLVSCFYNKSWGKKNTPLKVILLIIIKSY